MGLSLGWKRTGRAGCTEEGIVKWHPMTWRGVSGRPSKQGDGVRIKTGELKKPEPMCGPPKVGPGTRPVTLTTLKAFDAPRS